MWIWKVILHDILATSWCSLSQFELCDYNCVYLRVPNVLLVLNEANIIWNQLVKWKVLSLEAGHLTTKIWQAVFVDESTISWHFFQPENVWSMNIHTSQRTSWELFSGTKNTLIEFREWKLLILKKKKDSRTHFWHLFGDRINFSSYFWKILFCLYKPHLMPWKALFSEIWSLIY